MQLLALSLCGDGPDTSGDAIWCMKKYFRTKNLLSDLALQPRFVEAYGHVILADCSRSLWPTSDPRSEEERHKTEYLLNRRDVVDLFEVPPADPSNRLLWEAGIVIRDTWQARLNVEFPNRNILVCFEFALPICEVSFFQAMEWQIQAANEVSLAGKTARRVDWRDSLAKMLALKSKPKSE
jgi:hypothetical protein